MAATTYLAPALKQLAGVPGGGRRLAKPVYHYSLNWPPDENPTPDEMRAAGESSLKALGMNDRQAVIVEHRDRKHSHVHIVVNRVSPEDGRAASTGQDQIKLKNWAREHERDQGRIRCQRRIDWSIKPQRRQGPDRMPRPRAHRRAWSNLYNRQRKQCSRKGQSKELDQLHLLQRVKLARKIERDVARYQRRLKIRAAVTEAARTRVSATTAAIGTFVRKVAVTITPKPRTDAERTRIALDHINKPDRPGILPRLAAAGSAALSVVPAVAAGARAAIAAAVSKPPAGVPERTTGLSAKLADSEARRKANERELHEFYGRPDGEHRPTLTPEVASRPATGSSLPASGRPSRQAAVTPSAGRPSDSPWSLIAAAAAAVDAEPHLFTGRRATDVPDGRDEAPTAADERRPSSEAAHRAPEADRTRGGETRPAVRGDATPSPVQPPPVATPRRRPAVRGGATVQRDDPGEAAPPPPPPAPAVQQPAPVAEDRSDQAQQRALERANADIRRQIARQPPAPRAQPSRSAAEKPLPSPAPRAQPSPSAEPVPEPKPERDRGGRER